MKIANNILFLLLLFYFLFRNCLLRKVVQSTLLFNFTLIDGNGGNPRPNCGLIINDKGKIYNTRPQNATHMDILLSFALYGGITSIRDMGGDVPFLLPYVSLGFLPKIPYPRIYYSCLIGGPDFMLDPRVQQAAHGTVPGTTGWLRSITNTTDIPAAIKSAVDIGVTGIKIYADLDKNLTVAITKEAKKQGLRIWAHSAIFPTKPSEEVAAGIEVLSHTAYFVFESYDPMPQSYKVRFNGDYVNHSYNSQNITNLLQMIKQADVILDATVYVFTEPDSIRTNSYFSMFRSSASTASHNNDLDFPRIGQQWIFNVTRNAHELGIRICAGTDDLGSSELGDKFPNIHKEIELFVHECGFSPLEAITSVTKTASQAIGIDKYYGTIEPGKVADLVILYDDPSINITNTRKIYSVIKQGIFYTIPNQTL
ncbi:unnamed protein product [Rotaria sordida]|uniref:Amidohydrolase-related domain-containing protein n=1 Tax=Rotaria sordida TaxID=392033 RepID=A0A819PN93_9BILA|nr:unnamed protein product [Rotaria sordida]CAF4015990.1 unnamed protein product [Rotaria sordida]